jgi:Family of unknown function (DUF6069)
MNGYGYYDTPTTHLYDDQPTPTPTGRRPQLDAARLWSAGLATALVATLIGLVGVLVVRAVGIWVYAPRQFGTFGDSTTLTLCAGAALAALAATGLVQLLMMSTPRPVAYFGWIVGLLTVVAAVLPILAGGPMAVLLAEAVIHVVIGLAIGILVANAAGSALRYSA